MALTRRQLISISMPANADFSTNQFRIMVEHDDGRLLVAVDAATPPLGVLLNKPNVQDAAGEVATRGSIVKLEAGAAINERDAVRAVAGGRGSPTTTAGDYVIGRAISPASGSGVLFEVEVNPHRFSGTSA